MQLADNRTLRARVKETLRTHFVRYLMLKLATLALPLLMMYAMAISAASQTVAVSDPTVAALLASQVFGRFLLPLALVAAVQAILKTGFSVAQLDLICGEPVQGRVLISPWRHVLGCLGLRAWLALKTAAWAVPGLLLTTLGLSLHMQGVRALSRFAMVTGTAIIWIGFILALVLMIMASYRYAMADFIFAENPAVGVYDAVEQSKAVMNGRKDRLFTLTMPCWLGVLGLYALLAVAHSLFELLDYLLRSLMIGWLFDWLLILAFATWIAVAVVLLCAAELRKAAFYLSNT